MSRTEQTLCPDSGRVIAKPFLHGAEYVDRARSRASGIIERVLSIPDDKVRSILESTLDNFSSRHPDLEATLETSFNQISQHVQRGLELPRERRLLIGAYFTHEYSFESVALFNPSIVAAPDQSTIGDGEVRFVMSLRAVGEGHISSIEFRTGVIDAHGEVNLDPLSRYAATGRRSWPVYDKQLFHHKLHELGADPSLVSLVMDPLPPGFTYGELLERIDELAGEGVPRATAYETSRLIHWLASSNYVIAFPSQSAVSERVIFPSAPIESRGMEDARFVRFTENDGSACYYATYTAYDGFQILPQLIETNDFVSFRIATLNGARVQNKGMALFPRRIGGRYAALSRNDRENIFLMFSDNIHFWDTAERIRTPVHPWELTQIGNCGSPVETKAGWLVLTHGVGPMRSYTIGAILLDHDDPARVIGQLDEPLIAPGPGEREGYVPNVVYSCGALVHDGLLILPYGFADEGTKIATIALDELIGALLEH